MRLGSLTLSTTLSAVLLSGCSFLDGQSTQSQNPYLNPQSATYGQFGSNAVSQRCQIATPRHPIPRGCRPAQVTIGVPSQNFGAQTYSPTGFPQQPQFGQPQYTSGGYGAAIGQTQALAHNVAGPKKRKPKLRGSLSIGAERAIGGGELLDFGIRDDLGPLEGYNPQDFNEQFNSGSVADGETTSVTYTANEQFADNIFADNTFESSTMSNAAFSDAWSTPITVQAGLEYIISDHSSVFFNAGYGFAAGNDGSVGEVTATVYEQTVTQAFEDALPAGAPSVNTAFIPNQEIAAFTYDFSDLESYELEVGARHYFDPLVKSNGHRTVTPFVGGSLGVAFVNAVDVSIGQTQVSYSSIFTADEPDRFTVPLGDTTTRLYDSAVLPKGQLNVGAEWQITPGFALAAETGLKVQLSRDYEDFVNAAGETIEGANGDAQYSIPVTLRGSINF